MPQRVIRDARVDAGVVMIGDAPAPPREPIRSLLHVPPPPLPPPVPEDEEPTSFDEWGLPPEGGAQWAPPPDFGRLHATDHGSQNVHVEHAVVEPHPDAAEAARLLAEAEQMLLAAQVEMERLRSVADADAAALRDQATEELAAARAEAAELRQAAADDIDRQREEALEAARREGFELGLSEGRAAGEERAREETAEQVQRVAALAESASVDRRELLRNAEGEVVRLALEIARKVVQRDVRTDPTLVQRIAEAALQQVSIDGMVRLRVNPADHAGLSEYWARAHGAAEGDRTYDIVSDESIPAGGVVIDTRAGTVDARIETQVDEIAEKVFGGRDVLADR